jgi:hypothetical protein
MLMNSNSEVVGKCSLCNGPVLMSTNAIGLHCGSCGAVEEKDLPVIKMTRGHNIVTKIVTPKMCSCVNGCKAWACDKL